MKLAKDCPATAADIFNLGIRVLATWLVLQDPKLPLGEAILRASDTFCDVSKEHCAMLEGTGKYKTYSTYVPAGAKVQ